MRNPRTTHRASIVFVLLFAVAHAGWATQEWRAPSEPLDEIELLGPGESIRPGVDPCGCLRDLRSCLIASSLKLGRCLSRAHTPARQALCYLKFELDVLLCLDRAGVCELTCVP